MLAGRLTCEYWDQSDSENSPTSDDAHILLDWGEGHYKMLRGENFHKAQCDLPTIKHKSTDLI